MTASELIAELKKRGRVMSLSRLRQLRSGFTQTKNGKTYTIKPQLIEGEDWRWNRGEIEYSDSALAKLTGATPPAS